MSQNQWKSLVLGTNILVGGAAFLFAGAESATPPVKPVSVGASDDARNPQFLEIQKEVNACQTALKTDYRAGVLSCAKEKAPREISRFICRNQFFPCSKPSDKLRLQVAAAIWTLRSKSPLLKIQKGRGNLAELLVVLEDKNTAAKLAEACSGGSVQGFKAKPCQKWDGRDIAGWVSGFIGAAAANAHYFYRVKVGKASKNKTLKSIQKGSEAPSAFGTGAGKNPGGGVSRSFGVEQLYQDGAVTAWVVTNPQTGAGRWISVKYFSKREDGTSTIIQQVGIFDYTENPSQIYGRRYPVGDMDADNLDLVPNRAKFHVTIKNGEVTVFAAGSSQPAIKTNIQALQQLRLAQVNKEGYEEKIGNQTFKVIGQGGARGALLFFKEDAKGQVSDADPVAMADVNKMTDAGVQDLSAKPYKTGLGDFDTGKNGGARFWYMKRVGNGDMSYFKPVVCQESEAEKVGEKCGWDPAEKDKKSGKQAGNDKTGGGSSGGSGNSGTVSKAGDCSEYTNFKNPVTQNGVAFVPQKDPASLICADGQEIEASGLLMSLQKEGGGLTLQVATPDIPEGSESTPDYQNIYGQALQAEPIVKQEDRGANLTSNFPTVYDIPVKQVETYTLSSQTLKNMPKTGFVPSVENLADTSEVHDLGAGKDGKLHNLLVQISASNPANAQSAWSEYKNKYSYYGKISAFLKSDQCAQGSTAGKSIEIRPLLNSEIKSAQADKSVVTCGKNKLTVRDLLN